MEHVATKRRRWMPRRYSEMFEMDTFDRDYLTDAIRLAFPVNAVPEDLAKLLELKVSLDAQLKQTTEQIHTLMDEYFPEDGQG